MKELIKSEEAQVLVGRDKDKAVAFSLSKIQKRPPAYVHETYGYIDSLTVKSDYCRKGIGEQMLAKIYDWFESRGIGRIEVNVVVKNQVSYSFWEKQGFQDYMHVMYLDK